MERPQRPRAPNYGDEPVSSLTADQVRSKHAGVLGPELGAVYNALYNELVWLHFQWGQYRKLFIGNEHLDVLNDAAGALFFVVQQTIALAAPSL